MVAWNEERPTVTLPMLGLSIALYHKIKRHLLGYAAFYYAEATATTPAKALLQIVATETDEKCVFFDQKHTAISCAVNDAVEKFSIQRQGILLIAAMTFEDFTECSGCEEGHTLPYGWEDAKEGR